MPHLHQALCIPGPGCLCPRPCCCSPHLSPGPHPYWLGYVHSVCRRAGRGAYTHGLQVIYTLCIYIHIYIYSIYIYHFTFIYILYRTFTFYQKQFCDFTYGLSSEILTPGQKQDWNEGLIKNGMGTEDRTLPLCQVAGPIPDVPTPPWETVPDVSIPETCLQDWAHFLHLSRGLGQPQMLSPYSCLTRAKSFPDGAPHRTIPDVGQSLACFQMFVHIAGVTLGGICFILSGEKQLQTHT